MISSISVKVEIFRPSVEYFSFFFLTVTAQVALLRYYPENPCELVSNVEASSHCLLEPSMVKLLPFLGLPLWMLPCKVGVCLVLHSRDGVFVGS